MLKTLVLALALLTATTFAQTEPAADSADAIWQKIQMMERQGPTSEAQTMDARKQAAVAFLNELEGLLGTFAQRFPTDRRVWEAKLDRVQVAAQLASLRDQTPDMKALIPSLREIVDAADASKPVKIEALYAMLQINAMVIIAERAADKVEAFDKDVADFIAKYPQDNRNRILTSMRLGVYEKAAPAKVEALLKELAADKNPQIAAEANQRLKLLEVKTKPLALKFTAVDGTEFDITKWRGKVVLVDFWATWCGPCRMSLPNVLNVYQKYHDKGFEIVGISLDQNKDKLLAFAKEKGMVWPQYFDGKVWQNEISSGFGIAGIPAMWLVDKKGLVRNTEAESVLDSEIPKLLQE